MYSDIYKEWLREDTSVNKGTPTINAARYLTPLLQYKAITMTDKQVVEKENNVTEAMNLVLFHEIRFLRSTRNDTPTEGTSLFQFVKDKGVYIDIQHWFRFEKRT